ncbi:MAG: Hpt domain-containing protein [Blautia sp.]|nr:Hpt domain-containing protein [Blautia sp.]
MTLQELYQYIGGDYDAAIRVMRMEKLVDKHIRKLAKNGVVEQLFSAADHMDAAQMFESAHALKGICSNLGLLNLAAIADVLSEEYRPGSNRKLSEEEVAQKVTELRSLYEKAKEGIRLYEG